ncbi:unnamed protein product [Cuscuta epithymum]|uniref:Uncharacterized protein n=1 Tax=Cuscuta epithymum TaxID=186058 RepID=A0AAV0BZP6_9ASTE|nr:unnamed protein product [Cuscuta epithymum]
MDLNTGMQTLNPGMSSEIVISLGSALLEPTICDDPDAETRFPIPNEKALRKKKAKQPTGAPFQSPFQAPRMQFRERPSLIGKHLQQHRDKKVAQLMNSPKI